MSEQYPSLTPELRARLDQAIRARDKTPHSVSAEAGRNEHAARNVISGHTASPGIVLLDDLCQAAGFANFVHFATGQPPPRLDMRILQRCVANAIRVAPRRKEYFPIDWISACVAVFYAAETQADSDGRPPYAGEDLGAWIYDRLGMIPRSREEEIAWRRSKPALEILGEDTPEAEEA